MKRTFLTVLFLMESILMIACQPTPEEEVVQNRKEGSLEQAIIATAAPTFSPEEKYGAPEKWTEELEFRGEKIYIDADIELAEGSAFEVLTVVHDDYSEENVLSVLETLLGGNLEVREQNRSYDELLIDLQNAQKGHFADFNEKTGEIIWEPYKGQEEEIQELKGLLAETSPEETFVSLADKIEYPIDAKLIRTKNGDCWYTSCNPLRFLLKKHRKTTVQWESIVMAGWAFPGEKGHALEVTNITEEEAIAAAEAFIAPLQKQEMSITEVQKARELESYTYKVLSTGYYITMVGNPANTVPCLYSGYDGNYFLNFTQGEETSYSEPWNQECMALYVTAEGVQMFSWNFRKKVIGTANENVQILPFEQVQERIRTLLEFGVREGSNNPIYITRMTLGSAIQQVANQGNEAFMAPAWMIFFTTEFDKSLNQSESLLMLSALDGSILYG